MHYKAPDNSLHYIDSSDFAHLLPEGSVVITDDEAEEIRTANTPQPTYAELRRAEYPSFLDLIDGLVKGDSAQVQAYKDACLAVKAKYPKP
jgi:hypothetical protein